MSSSQARDPSGCHQMSLHHHAMHHNSRRQAPGPSPCWPPAPSPQEAQAAQPCCLEVVPPHRLPVSTSTDSFFSSNTENSSDFWTKLRCTECELHTLPQGLTWPHEPPTAKSGPWLCRVLPCAALAHSTGLCKASERTPGALGSSSDRL